MAKCSLRFYEKSKLSPEKNWCFDNIETYLGTLTAFDVSDFQYQRFELDKEIRVDFTQNEQTISSSAKKYNYLRISTTINNTAIYYYYFIIKTRQVSESTIAYQLRMDTINTFKYSASSGNDKYTLSAKTLVKREHKDRLTNPQNNYRYTELDDVTIDIARMGNQFSSLSGTIPSNVPLIYVRFKLFVSYISMCI